MTINCKKYHGQMIYHFAKHENNQLQNVILYFPTIHDANNYIRSLPGRLDLVEISDVYSKFNNSVYEYRSYNYVSICKFYLVIPKKIENNYSNFENYTISQHMYSHSFDISKIDFCKVPTTTKHKFLCCKF
jgi:hypothetical protein